MSKYIIDGSTLDSIVDAVNEFSQDRSKMKPGDISSKISLAGQTTTEQVATQADLIVQIKNALAGKARGNNN